MLHILLPTILPTAIPPCFRTAATMVVASSGNDVPSATKVRPMIVQNRCYAAFKWDQEVREICKDQGMIYQSFSLLTANPEVIRDQSVAKIADRVGSTPLQVVFRFAQQIGMLPLTGTTNSQHMKEDLAIERFDLTPEEMNYLEKIGSSL